MAKVHVFISRGRFQAFTEMRQYIDRTYNEDGDGIDSAFIKEVKLSSYEPMCIEAIHKGQVLPLSALLEGASYWEQWLKHVDTTKKADAAICVFEPNIVKHPTGCSMEYCGVFDYET